MQIEYSGGKTVKITADEVNEMIRERQHIDGELGRDEALGRIISEQMERPDVKAVTLVKEDDLEKRMREFQEQVQEGKEGAWHKIEGHPAAE